MKFLKTGQNYVGTPEGFIALEDGESIADLVSLTQCKWEEVSEVDESNLYKVHTWSTGFSVVLIPGFPGVTPGGDLVNCVSLGDQYFNGNFVKKGKAADLEFSETMSVEVYQKVWGPEWDRNTPWYRRAWECRKEGIEI